MKISVEGADPEAARLIVVLLHGGGSPAAEFLGLSQEFEARDDVCWLAPQALQSRWFPARQSESRSVQEPYLTVSSKSVLGLLERHSQQRIILAGFADGASVVAEVLADPDLPSAVVAAWMSSGGLVGPLEHWPEKPPKLTLPLLISGLRETIEETADFFHSAGASVLRHYDEGGAPGISAEEIAMAERLLREARG